MYLKDWVKSTVSECEGYNWIDGNRKSKLTFLLLNKGKKLSYDRRMPLEQLIYE